MIARLIHRLRWWLRLYRCADCGTRDLLFYGASGGTTFSDGRGRLCRSCWVTSMPATSDAPSVSRRRADSIAAAKRQVAALPDQVRESLREGQSRADAEAAAISRACRRPAPNSEERAPDNGPADSR